MTSLIGLILCGGRSSRMGIDKSQLTYHQQPQFLHGYNLLSSVCDSTFISCRQDQLSLFEKFDCEVIVDSASYVDVGPMAVLLSAFDQFPQASFLLLGCDYPNIEKDDLASLVKAREKGVEAVCFVNEQEIDEPLIAIYENEIGARLQGAFEKGELSLRYLLREASVKRVRPGSEERIKNVNSADQADNISRRSRR